MSTVQDSESARGVPSLIRLAKALSAGTPDWDRGMAELRSQYLENRVQELASLANALERCDFPALAKAGHNLKGTGAAYGFEELTQLGKALENAAKAEDGRQVEVLLGRTEVYLSRVRAGHDHR